MKDVGEKTPAGLVDYLRDWRAPGLHVPKAQLAIAPVELRRAAQMVERLLGDLKPRTPEPYALDAIADGLRGAWQASYSLAGVPPRDLWRAPWVFFRPYDHPDRWLAQLSDLIEAWLAWMDEHLRARAVVVLLREFLAAYPQELACFEPIRRWLERQVTTSRTPRLTRWAERSRNFGLLARDAPLRLTGPWWNHHGSFESYAGEAGLVPGLEHSDLVRRATRTMLDHVEARLRSGEATTEWLQRAFEWIAPSGRLRFGELRIGTAEAMLSPFLQQSPEPPVQHAIQEILLRAIGHPGPQREQWQGISVELRAVLSRWLVDRSLEDFFRVLDKTAEERHWRFRKAFWSAYLERDVISEAWVVLGPAARQIVRRDLKEVQNDAGTLLSGDGAQANHSVLLLRIGNLTIAEWSHNGKCRVWVAGNRAAPRLYEARYGRRQLMDGCDWDKAHMRSEDGGWQSQIAQQIERHTRIRVPSSEYMPKGRR
ncbi:hypothetical protein KJ059_13710 [Myxococcota bacterium]|nr:hypothetical protein [Myxococcota bacterium]